MRKSALSAAILALATIPTSASLADDFSALLADLSFGDAPSIDQPLAVAETTTPVELKQIEEAGEVQELDSDPGYGFSMPGMLESDAFEVATAPEAEPAPEVGPAPEAEPAPEVESAPQVALKDPIPASVPEPADQVNLDAAFALQDLKAAQTETPAQTVGHHCNKCDNHCDSHYCGSDYGCMPHIRPNLPSSTLYQYFRSSPCYANVWDGYRRKCCGDFHKHLHGYYHGSKKSHSWSSIFDCGHKDCGTCDVGCDH